MRKLRLDIDELQVESFTIARDASRGSGSVRAHAQATYGCTEGYAGCAAETIGETCDVLCSDTHGGFSCDYFTCVNQTCNQGNSCQSEALCRSFDPCTGDACVFY